MSPSIVYKINRKIYDIIHKKIENKEWIMAHYKLAFSIIKYSIFWTILLFLTAMYFPDSLNINERVSLWILELVSIIVVIINYEKWKQLLISIPIGFVLLILLIVLYDS